MRLQLWGSSSVTNSDNKGKRHRAGESCGMLRVPSTASLSSHRALSWPGTGVSSRLRNEGPAPTRALPGPARGDSDMPGTAICQHSSVPKESPRNWEHRHAHTTGSHWHFLLQASPWHRRDPTAALSRGVWGCGKPQGPAVTQEHQGNVPLESQGPQRGTPCPAWARSRSSCLRLWMSL